MTNMAMINTAMDNMIIGKRQEVRDKGRMCSTKIIKAMTTLSTPSTK